MTGQSLIENSNCLGFALVFNCPSMSSLLAKSCIYFIAVPSHVYFPDSIVKCHLQCGHYTAADIWGRKILPSVGIEQCACGCTLEKIEVVEVHCSCDQCSPGRTLAHPWFRFPAYLCIKYSIGISERSQNMYLNIQLLKSAYAMPSNNNLRFEILQIKNFIWE